MNRILRLFMVLGVWCLVSAAWADGTCIPFFRNFPASEYKGHNRNYDILCDQYGTVFVANFEGLLYYDGSRWKKIYTPGISRITCLARDAEGRIWYGGYNVFGYLYPDEDGRLQMHSIVSDADKSKFGEVAHITTSGSKVYLKTTASKCYMLENDSLLKPVDDSGKLFPLVDSKPKIHMPSGFSVSYDHSSGLSFSNDSSDDGVAWTALSESNGLISNTVNRLAYNHSNLLWGATDKGLFCVEADSPYGLSNSLTGLRGEVNCIFELDGITYFGTMEGVFYASADGIRRLGNYDLACWKIVRLDDSTLLFATTIGLFAYSHGDIRRLSEGNTLSVCIASDGSGWFTGELDGIYHSTIQGERRKISTLEKVTHITQEGQSLKAENIFGEVWSVPLGGGKAKCLRKKADLRDPKISYTDPFGTLWTTDNNGQQLVARSHNRYADVLEPWTVPFRSKSINALHVSESGDVWIGGDFGAYLLDGGQLPKIKTGKAQAPYIREVTIMGDSVIWGGFSPNMKPLTEVRDLIIPSSCMRVQIHYSSQSLSIVSPTRYRYRINGGHWSAWNEESHMELNLYYGTTEIEIQALDLFGRVSPSSHVEIYRMTPRYMRWWAWVAYLILFIYGARRFYRWRTKKLKRDKEKLEAVVAERTSELSTALDDLKRTQNDLVRMERTATAGKLTQGLIDRILNPINYINNFSKLTSGLARDLREDIEDEKENMSEDNYEDCEDILDMMTKNLQKIETHGVNTTRTLRAMEAVLNNNVGSLVTQDILHLCRQAVKVTAEHFKADIAKCGINLHADLPETPVLLGIDAESFNKVLLSMLGNSIYAVVKKFSQAAYTDPEVCLSISVGEEDTQIVLRDNGIGIEKAIQEKVFDPFFTTKPTGEASGVGLYLVRDIISAHGGTISLESQQGDYCKFTITLPNRK